MESVEGVKKKRKKKESRIGKRYGFELKLRCVKLKLWQGLPFSYKNAGTQSNSAPPTPLITMQESEL